MPVFCILDVLPETGLMKVHLLKGLLELCSVSAWDLGSPFGIDPVSATAMLLIGMVRSQISLGPVRLVWKRLFPQLLQERLLLFRQLRLLQQIRPPLQGADDRLLPPPLMDLLVVAGGEEFEVLNGMQREAYGENASTPELVYGFDVGGSEELQSQTSDLLFHRLAGRAEDGGAELPVSVSSVAGSKEGSLGIFGGLFFIGVFLGILFLMATVLIIYYKQLSEGYDDAARFAIMKKVGMSGKEIRRSIHSQVLTVFFLPLVGAGIHVAVAFPFLTRVLSLFNMRNVTLFAVCTACTIAAFGLFYLVVYRLTARVYYRIVR